MVAVGARQLDHAVVDAGLDGVIDLPGAGDHHADPALTEERAVLLVGLVEVDALVVDRHRPQGLKGGLTFRGVEC